MTERRGKYNARKTTIDGITFDSKAEAARYMLLRTMEQAGEITGLQIHPRFLLQEGFRHNGKAIRAIHYEADFEYIDADGNRIIEDVKGHRTAVFNIKRKLFLHRYSNLDIVLIQ